MAVRNQNKAVKKKRMSEIKQPKDFTLELDGMGKSKITFQAFGYPYNKGADGRVLFQVDRSLQEGHIGPNDDPELTLSMTLNTRLCGMTYSDLKNLSAWAAKAATFVKDIQIHDGYPADDK